MSIFYFGGFSKKPTSLETRTYMNGECAYFALALHKQNPSSTLIEADGKHFAVKDDQGYYWDIRGRSTLSDFLNGLGENSLVKEVDESYVIKQMNTGLYSDGVYVPFRKIKASKLLKKLLA